MYRRADTRKWLYEDSKPKKCKVKKPGYITQCRKWFRVRRRKLILIRREFQMIRDSALFL